MTIETDIPVEDRVLEVLQHLGISNAHFAGRTAGDWTGLATKHPDTISSLALICPPGFDPGVIALMASRLLVFSGEQGAQSERIKRTLDGLPDATLITLAGYSSPNTYGDVAMERTEDLASGLVKFFTRMERGTKTLASTRVQVQGDVAGISYLVQGSGPPLVLLPLSAAPSQWEPLLPRLNSSYTTITLGGAELGMVASLEARGRTDGYLGAVASLLDAAQIQPGDSVLEVGCGTGVLDRWMARRTVGRNQIVGVDVNPFFLREAAALAKKDGLEKVIEFKEGSAEALPLPDDSIDVAMSSTVIQRVNADRMLAEMVRVTKKGGRLAVLGHAHDMNRWVNLPLRPKLKDEIESPPWAEDPGHEQGCDDAGLYRRFNELGLTRVKMFPVIATFADGPNLQNLQSGILSTLSQEEAEEWRAALTQAERAGTFFITTPFHCTVGTKP